MKVLLLLSLLMSVAVQQCTKKNSAQVIPSCVQQKIDSIKAQPVWNPPATVWQYRYKGKIVYLFSANCCDQYISLFDEQCHYICAPSGGITGKGDLQCKDFYNEAQQVKMVWKDERR